MKLRHKTTGEIVEMSKARIYSNKVDNLDTGQVYSLDHWESVNPDGDYKSLMLIRNE